MDNRGILARVNSRDSQIRRYEAYHRIQDPSECWPFDTPVMHQSLRVPLSNRRGKKVVEAAEPSSRRINTETKNVPNENNRETPIVISSGSEDDSDDDDDAAIANVGNIGNDSAPNPVTELANLSQGPNEGAQVEDRGKRVASEIEIDFLSESEKDSDDDDDAGFPRQLNVPCWDSFNTQNGEASEPSARREVENLVDVYNLGNVGNASASNEDSVDERAQFEALEADIGKLISNMELTEPMPRPPVSSRGRALKPTVKLLEMPNATIDGPSKRKRKDGPSTDRQTKPKAAKPAPAVPRFNVGDTTLNHRPRGLLRRQNVTGASEPRGPGSVVGQASVANGMDRAADVVNTNGSGAGAEVGVSAPSGSGSLGGQAAPIIEPVVCVTNRNPMDLPVEEAVEYMRSEDRVTSTHKVKLFGQYLS